MLFYCCKKFTSYSSALARPNTSRLYFFTLLTSALILALPKPASANNTGFNFSDNTRWAKDISARHTDTAKPDSHNESSAQLVTGLDFYTKVTNDGRDIATIVFQPYWIELNNRANPPPFFSDGDDGALNWRIVTVNYTGLSRGEFNIKLGHLELPFGIEKNIDTNGTIRQFTISDRNIKADWGASINGVLPILDYELSWTRGTGNNYSDNPTTGDDPSIFVERIGTTSTENSIWGLSFSQGHIVTGSTTSERNRQAIDWAYYYNRREFLTEASMGDNGQTDTRNAFFELGWNNLKNTLRVYKQLQYRTRELSNNIDIRFFTLGAQWFINRKVDVSAGLTKVFADNSSNDKSTANIQFRIRL